VIADDQCNVPGQSLLGGRTLGEEQHAIRGKNRRLRASRCRAV
jgi:hypothetical protein